MTIYSQNSEQPAILAACSGIQNGKFLDIGAWHAKDKSNTRALYEAGWGGVLIEPSPGPFDGLQKEYGAVDRITLVNLAVSFDGNPVRMFITDDAVSTSDPATYEKWRPHIQYKDESIVDTITLEDLYAKHGPFDFVSIDAEGISVDLMHRLFALNQFPKCICVEYDDRLPEASAAATEHGYAATYVSGENVVFVKQ